MKGAVFPHNMQKSRETPHHGMFRTTEMYTGPRKDGTNQGKWSPSSSIRYKDVQAW